MDILVENNSRDTMEPESILPAKEHTIAYVIDLMALIRTFTSYPDTYEGLARKIFASIPTGYKLIDIVADSYLPQSIKTAERNKRGMAPKVIVRSMQSKLPRDFNKFLSNGENKTRMIELVRGVLIEHKESILPDLKCDGVYFSSYRECILVTKDDVVLVPDLSSSQEEADTKVVLHADHALRRHDEGIAIIRSHSGDTDIAIIALSHSNENGDRVILDSNTGKHRKAFKLSDIDLTASQKSCLAGFHAFTGNDYNSAFFRKGKRMCWKLLETKPRFVETFCLLGASDVLPSQVSQDLDKYVFLLYGIKTKNVNEARYAIFDRKLTREQKVTDIALLPPCRQTLQLHKLRAHFIAREWRSAGIKDYEGTDACDNGWNEEMEPKWMETMMPEDVQELFIDNECEDFSECSDLSDCED